MAGSRRGAKSAGHFLHAGIMHGNHLLRLIGVNSTARRKGDGEEDGRALVWGVVPDAARRPVAVGHGRGVCICVMCCVCFRAPAFSTSF